MLKKLLKKIFYAFSYEVDYFFRDSLVSLANFFKVIKKYPNIKYWLPHLGCGIFLHWDKILDICEKSPSLLTSTVNYNLWAEILKLPYYKKMDSILAHVPSVMVGF